MLKGLVNLRERGECSVYSLCGVGVEQSPAEPYSLCGVRVVKVDLSPQRPGLIGRRRGVYVQDMGERRQTVKVGGANVHCESGSSLGLPLSPLSLMP